MCIAGDSDRQTSTRSPAGVNVVAANTDEDARFLASSGRQSFANMRRGLPAALPPPSQEHGKDVVTFGQIPLTEVTSVAVVGSPATVATGLKAFVAQTRPDEVMVVSHTTITRRACGRPRLPPGCKQL